MTQSLAKQISDLKQRIEEAKGTPAEATFKQILADLEAQEEEAPAPATTPSLSKPTKPTPTPPTTQTTSETAPTETAQNKEERETESGADHFFQAVGQLRGIIRRKEDESGWFVALGQNEYDLALSKKLQYVIHFVEGEELTLTVYPQIRYEKGRRDYCKIYFKLVGWTEERSPDEGLFIIKGIWQFIPQYKRPVISVYRNQKQWEGDRCKASHIPVLWKDAPVRPFKFNPKNKTQGNRYFTEVKTKFIPRLNTFGFIESFAEPTLKIPRYVKPVKKPINSEHQEGSQRKEKPQGKEKA